ncbi:LLM class flavin-dependent oxidoreductase, partial [Nocardia cyriacigeorgica]|uniref:LLM class flavin-dependent oxidoreductase n=1 Tax=Nocardia cyriacigeorgica TaxID=135487 RepID=UPI002453784E
MTIDIYWRIGMEGDHASLRTPRRYNRGHANGYGGGNIAPAIRGGRLDDYGYIDHMAAVARASESAGFLGGLLPSFPVTDDPWAVSAALARETTTYRFMVAFQPGFLHPVQAARMSASLQRATGGRLVYNIISGGGGPAQLWWGDKVAHDDGGGSTAACASAARCTGCAPWDTPAPAGHRRRCVRGHPGTVRHHVPPRTRCGAGPASSAIRRA